MKHELAPTRDRLIRAAIGLFQAQGYFAVSVNDILVDAQAPKGSLYHHFPGGKADLAVAAVNAIADDVQRWLLRAQKKGMSPAELVRALAHDMAGWMRKSGGAQGALLSVLALECAAREPQVHAAVKTAYRVQREALAQLIGGDAKTARATADLILATLEGGLILARAEGRPAPLIAAAERLSAML